MSAFVTGDAVRLADFSRICAQRTNASDYPLCLEVQGNVPIYQAHTLRNSDRLVVMNELHHLFRDGPGVMVVRQAYEDLEVVDRHSQVFDAIFAHEAAQGVAADHFAKAGSNGRIWNALQKAALQSPESFAEYYANPLLGLIAEAWLGPGFQVTAQVNVVHPGGQAQQPHRDYHLGFPDQRCGRTFSAAAACAVPTSHVARCYRTFGYAAGNRPHPAAALFPAVCLGVPGVASHGVYRLLPAPRGAIAAEQGRLAVLQPGTVPCRRHQPHGRSPAHGQPAANLLGIRQADGSHRPRPHDCWRCIRCCSPTPTWIPAPWSPVPQTGTPSPLTSTPTHP